MALELVGGGVTAVTVAVSRHTGRLTLHISPAVVGTSTMDPAAVSKQVSCPLPAHRLPVHPCIVSILAQQADRKRPGEGTAWLP